LESRYDKLYFLNQTPELKKELSEELKRERDQVNVRLENVFENNKYRDYRENRELSSILKTSPENSVIYKVPYEQNSPVRIETQSSSIGITPPREKVPPPTSEKKSGMKVPNPFKSNFGTPSRLNTSPSGIRKALEPEIPLDYVENNKNLCVGKIHKTYEKVL
jgi:hypothetical protein